MYLMSYSHIRTCKLRICSFSILFMDPFQFLLCFAALCSSLEKGQPYIFRVGSGQVLISACLVGVHVLKYIINWIFKSIHPWFEYEIDNVCTSQLHVYQCISRLSYIDKNKKQTENTIFRSQVEVLVCDLFLLTNSYLFVNIRWLRGLMKGFCQWRLEDYVGCTYLVQYVAFPPSQKRCNSKIMLSQTILNLIKFY
jgi:hypothetical protein